MTIVSWNINGLMASLEHGTLASFQSEPPAILCLQEIRTKDEPTVLEGYTHIWNHGAHDGYSGTAIITQTEPLRVLRGFGGSDFDEEGRLLTIELTSCFVVNAYVPNPMKDLWRSDYRLSWDTSFREYISELQMEKPVLLCGDFNVTRAELDSYKIEQEDFVTDEQSNFETLLEELRLVDVFRAHFPDVRSYTWWSSRRNKRKDNCGLRLDYFLSSEELMDKVQRIEHLTSVTGSDHCPILLEVSLL